MNEYLLWVAKEGYTTPDEGPLAIAKFIADKATDGDMDPFREFLTNVVVDGRGWQGRERSVGIDSAGYTEFELNEVQTDDWAVEVWNALDDGQWNDKFNEYALDKVNDA